MNSNLVDYTLLSPNCDSPREDSIKKITIHHMAGNFSVEDCGRMFFQPSRDASSNYSIGTDGRVGMYVEECDRAWTSGNADNDNQAITIEVANEELGGDWKVSEKAFNKLIDLCVDICKRNDIKLVWTGDSNGTLTTHDMFQATMCPGPYLKSKMAYIASEVNRRVEESEELEADDMIYRVQVGAFVNKENAENMLGKLQEAGFEGFIVEYDNGMPAPDFTPKKSIDELAHEVIEGKWGVDPERTQLLINAGYDAVAVQNRVDELL